MDGRLACWTENGHYTHNIFYGNTPNRKQIVGETTVCLNYAVVCGRNSLTERDRQKGKQEKKKNDNKIKRSDEICEKQTNLCS